MHSLLFALDSQPRLFAWPPVELLLFCWLLGKLLVCPWLLTTWWSLLASAWIYCQLFSSICLWFYCRTPMKRMLPLPPTTLSDACCSIGCDVAAGSSCRTLLVINLFLAATLIFVRTTSVQGIGSRLARKSTHSYCFSFLKSLCLSTWHCGGAIVLFVWSDFAFNLDKS